MEDVTGWRVVDDDGVFQITAYYGQVLDVVALVVEARLSEQTVLDDLVDIEHVQNWVRILCCAKIVNVSWSVK